MADLHQDAIQKLPPHEMNKIKRVIAVMSGKGGVGKSSVSALLAARARKSGYRVGILDADITGPSIPKMLGVSARPEVTEHGMIAPESAHGIRVMSLNLLLDQEDRAVIWRGPLMASVIRQFWTDVIWGELDFLIIDLPPGTGDAPLTIMQSLPVDGVVVVTTPQPLAEMIVRKAANMATMMEVPIVGVVENMSRIDCPQCGHPIHPFGKPDGERFAAELGAPLLASLPLDPELTEACNRGEIEAYEGTAVDVSAVLAELTKKL